MEPPSRPARRRRVLLACSSCRARKTKCDARQPACSTCRAAGEACEYSSQGIHTSSKVLVNKEYIRSLEEKVQQYEREKSAITAQLPQGQLTLPPARMNPTPLSNLSIACRPSLPTNTVKVSPTAASVTSRIVTADPEVFLGGDSGLSFTQLIWDAMSGRTSHKLQTHPLSQKRYDAPPQNPLSIFNTPPDAEELIAIFFDVHFELGPFFHEPTVRAAFRTVLDCDTSSREDHRCTLAIMNMIFAMSSLHHRVPANRKTNLEARAFYDTAMSLLQPRLLLDWNIEKVQALLLGVRYLQSSNSPDECWNVLGLAIRIAHGLELHLPPHETLDCIAKETAKRVWAACFSLDKLLSMIYGRPSMTSMSNSSCPLPEDLNDDCVQKSRLLYPNPRKPSTISFSIHVAKLYRIVEAADQISSLEKQGWGALAGTVFSLDEELELWYHEVPIQLKVHDGMKHESEPVLILALRANMVRILIHRQSLAVILQSLSENSDESLNRNSLKASMLQKSRNICVHAALETITLVGMRNQRTIDAIGPGWFNLYYLFNAILVIVSHVIDPAFRDDRVALERLDKAMYMINQMSRSHSCAQRAYLFLQELLKLMNSSLKYDASAPLSQEGMQFTNPISEELKEQTLNDHLAVHASDSQASHNVDFSTLLDVTQGLAENLGSQLESYSAADSVIWAWMNENVSPDDQAGNWSSSF